MIKFLPICLFALTLPFLNRGPVSQPDKWNQEETSAADLFQPVDNMHHFMEYISEPSYKGLKAALATQPKGRKGWSPVKSDALILAETSALVAERVPEGADAEKATQWKQISLDVYNASKALYGSVGDYEQAKKHYSVMIDNCNRCHQTFANGKYQLKK
ncbi:MAG: hypothetical protein P8J91_18900 [Pirellulaceae bacterium]|nr:hypothetical protein [Pirellulaceae bacterium]MDG2105829.1 hypothetical protein [Pirellulaceae bacterium]